MTPSLKAKLSCVRFAFLDIGPLSKGHALVVPKGDPSVETRLQPILTDVTIRKDHVVKMHELPDEYLADALPIAKKIALAQGLENYNILQVFFAPIFLLCFLFIRCTRHRTMGA